MPQGKPGQPGHSRREGGEVVPFKNLLGDANYNRHSIYRITFADGCTTHTASNFGLSPAARAAEDMIDRASPDADEYTSATNVHGTIIEAKRIRQPIPPRLR
jgi:hypothetical protein